MITPGDRKRNGGHDAVAATRQEGEERPCLIVIARLAKDPATGGNNGISRQNQRIGMPRRHGPAFFQCHAFGITCGQFCLRWGFVNIGGVNAIRGNANAGQKVKPTR